MVKKVSIKEDYIKLDSLLKFIGEAATGGHAKILISNGEVKVNNEVCLMRGKKIRKGDKVQINLKEIIIE
ncbi:MAG: RNA-binding S4 domain-containing protein [Clostridia bacterium]|nr:RNA-binding S4 domain-containing protein [Clostridia bacterium]